MIEAKHIRRIIFTKNDKWSKVLELKLNEMSGGEEQHTIRITKEGLSANEGSGVRSAEPIVITCEMIEAEQESSSPSAAWERLSDRVRGLLVRLSNPTIRVNPSEVLEQVPQVLTSDQIITLGEPILVIEINDTQGNSETIRIDKESLPPWEGDFQLPGELIRVDELVGKSEPLVELIRHEINSFRNTVEAIREDIIRKTQVWIQIMGNYNSPIYQLTHRKQEHVGAPMSTCFLASFMNGLDAMRIEHGKTESYLISYMEERQGNIFDNNGFINITRDLTRLLNYSNLNKSILCKEELTSNEPNYLTTKSSKLSDIF